MFHIGVLAHSLEGAAELLRRLRASGAARPDRRQQPELTLSWAPLGSNAEPWQRGDLEAARTQLVLSSVRLRDAGAHFFVCPDDTAYLALEAAGPDLAVPGLHAASVVAAEAQRQGFGRVGILGTRWTMGWRRYLDDLEPLGITAVPLPLAEQTTLHSVIFDELVHGRCSVRSRDTVLEIIAGMQLQGCQAVVLGCTELSSLVTPSTSPLPLLDSTALLAAAAMAVAVGDASLPSWRGGPSTSGLSTLLVHSMR